MKYKLIIMFLLISATTFACQCVEFNEKNIKGFKKNVDFIVVGTVVNNIDWNNNEFLNSRWKKEKSASEVIVKVEQIIKGKLNSDYIYIYQLDAGNCSRNFKNGMKYVFTGYKIKKFINLTPNQPINAISNDTLTNEIPFVELDRKNLSSQEYRNKRMYYSNMDFDFENWNKVAKQKNVIRTSSCLSNSLNSGFGKLVVNN
jgi:hypothetical protein